MRAFLAGARVQLRFFRAYPDALIPFFTAPVFSIIFQMIFRHAGDGSDETEIGIRAVEYQAAIGQPLRGR